MTRGIDDTPLVKIKLEQVLLSSFCKQDRPPSRSMPGVGLQDGHTILWAGLLSWLFLRAGLRVHGLSPAGPHLGATTPDPPAATLRHKVWKTPCVSAKVADSLVSDDMEVGDKAC